MQKNGSLICLQGKNFWVVAGEETGSLRAWCIPMALSNGHTQWMSSDLKFEDKPLGSQPCPFLGHMPTFTALVVLPRGSLG